MLRTITKTIVTLVLPEVITKTIDWLNDKPEEPVKKPRRTMDSTKFTQGMMDFAVKEYKYWKANGLVHADVVINTQHDLTDYLNDVFSTHKSTTAMSRLFKGQIDRDTLARGHKYPRSNDEEV